MPGTVFLLGKVIACTCRVLCAGIHEVQGIELHC